MILFFCFLRYWTLGKWYSTPFYKPLRRPFEAPCKALLIKRTYIVLDWTLRGAHAAYIIAIFYTAFFDCKRNN